MLPILVLRTRAVETVAHADARGLADGPLGQVEADVGERRAAGVAAGAEYWWPLGNYDRWQLSLPSEDDDIT